MGRSYQLETAPLKWLSNHSEGMEKGRGGRGDLGITSILGLIDWETGEVEGVLTHELDV